MALPDGFPAKDKLEREGYKSVGEVSEATDEELLSVEGVAEGTLAKIREVAPYRASPEESGTGATSGKREKEEKQEYPEGVDPEKAESVSTQGSKPAKDQTDPVTGEDLPEGCVKNERGTITATSEVEQEGFVSAQQVAAEKKTLLMNARNRLAAIFEE